MFNISDEIAFDNYVDFLKFVYTMTKSEGKVDEIIHMIKTTPKGRPFDFEYNTQEGKTCHAMLPCPCVQIYMTCCFIILYGALFLFRGSSIQPSCYGFN